MADIKTIDDENFAGKKVLVRVDFNGAGGLPTATYRTIRASARRCPPSTSSSATAPE